MDTLPSMRSDTSLPESKDGRMTVGIAASAMADAIVLSLLERGWAPQLTLI